MVILFDIFLARKEKRMYPDPNNQGGKLPSTRYTTKFYCIKYSFILSRFPYFGPAYLEISPEVIGPEGCVQKIDWSRAGCGKMYQETVVMWSGFPLSAIAVFVLELLLPLIASIWRQILKHAINCKKGSADCKYKSNIVSHQIKFVVLGFRGTHTKIHRIVCYRKTC